MKYLKNIFGGMIKEMRKFADDKFMLKRLAYNNHGYF